MNKVTFCAVFLLLGIIGHMSVNAYPGFRDVFKKDYDDPKITVFLPGLNQGHEGVQEIIYGEVPKWEYGDGPKWDYGGGPKWGYGGGPEWVHGESHEWVQRGDPEWVHANGHEWRHGKGNEWVSGKGYIGHVDLVGKILGQSGEMVHGAQIFVDELP